MPKTIDCSNKPLQDVTVEDPRPAVQVDKVEAPKERECLLGREIIVELE
jgi:hypothetical protein